MNYDVDYFISKFEAIPEEKIGTSQLTGCAYGQCASIVGSTQDGCYTEEGQALSKIMQMVPKATDEYGFLHFMQYIPARINNGDVPEYQQPTPKQRILAALYDIKRMQEPEVKTITKYVAVSPTLREQSKEVVLS